MTIVVVRVVWDPQCGGSGSDTGPEFLNFSGPKF